MESGNQSSRMRPRSDSFEQEPLPQRRRCEEDPNDTASGSPRVSKDGRYYRTDGDCIIRVENTLFKIHRYHLSEDSSIFRSMFGLPTGTLPSEGKNDNDPIVLSGDTTTQFRAFLSFSPSQLQINRMSLDDVERLVNMIPFAHKYLLQQCLLWALESLERILIHSAAMVPADQYPTIFEVTALCTGLHAPICDRICGLVKRQWVLHIKSGAVAVGPALDIAERFNLRSFLVDLYCIVLDKLAATPDPFQAAGAADGPLAGISSTHKLRIFSGHWVLSRCWKEFVTQPAPALVHRAACAHVAVQGGCVTFWLHYWAKHIADNAAGEGNPESIFQRLDNFKSAMMQSAVNHGRCPGEMQVDDAIAAFKSSLVTHFFCAST
ncbi:hypothetical protein B0H17DRAFT_1274135 [Mycena rosella]|uniref:BTB domain-containing protein n=1 Tax=Mycena rosella TaxID=1033263 RepID=A0AAD7GZA4_MYCRO|nr:hypothetical protein B0H17DRAFT_1274135 [Mycena rosella]